MQMAQFLSLVRGDSIESPREITSPSNLISESGSNGWLIRFFDSSFFCEWIAVSYLYKHQHSGVRDYLCNRMYTLPLSGIESYLFQICYLMVHKPSPSLDKFVIDICAKSLKIALKVHWFLLAELEDSDDNEGISRIQEKCQIAATLVGEWSPLMRPHNEPSTPGSKVLNKFLSSKQKLFSLTLSPPTQKSLLFSPTSGSNLQDDGSQLSADDNKIFKRLIPSPKVRDALLFRKSADKEDEECEKVPYMICVEVLKAETPCGAKTTSTSLKLSKGGIPLANGDAFLHKPPPWAYPLSTAQEVYRNSADRMSLSTVEAIDQAMTHKSEVKLVNACLSVETHSNSNTKSVSSGVTGVLRTGLESDLEWVRLVLTADPGLRMESITDPKTPRRKEHRRVSSIVAYEEVRAAAAKGEAPPGLPLKGAGQDSSDAQPMANGGMLKAGDALSGEFWEGKRLRIRKDSIYGNLPGWDLRSIIVKSGDDCRQEHLAVQLISHFFDIFQEAGLPLWLRPYEVLVTSSYTALIETIPDTASIHSIKSRYPNITSLRDFFDAKFKENSPSFKLAQRNFVESMAGYSLVCYLLQIKDRHNGNLLMDEEGHIIHIDFGFMLSNSPGGVNFESAPFKLTRELLEVMDSDAEGLPSEFFDYFKVLCIQGFLTCRKHAERIILLVEMLQDSGFPCFKGGPRTIQNLRKRFHLSLTEEQCVSLVLSLISSSLDAWRTRQYDYYQRVLNGIR